MPLRPASVQPPCIVLVIDTWWAMAAAFVLLALPVAAALLIVRTLRRNPSAEYLAVGRRRGGVLVGRLATGATVVGILAMGASVVLQEQEAACDDDLTTWDYVGVSG